MRFCLFALLIFCFSCGSQTSEQIEKSVKSKNTFRNSRSFEMSDKNIKQLIKDWNHSLSSKDLDAAAALLADSVSVFLWDGSYYNTTRDSIILMLKDYVEKYSNVNVALVAGLAVRSKDTGEYWGLSWISETYTTDSGTAADLMLQESFLIQDGKIRSIRQYAQKYSENPSATSPVNQEKEEPEYTYSGSFEMDDDELKEIVNDWITALSTPSDFEMAASFLADSVHIFAATGDYIFGDRDSAMVYITQRITEYTKFEIEFVQSIAVKSTDRDQTWVLLWTEVTQTNQAGEEEIVFIHADYLIESNKISRIRRYSRTRPQDGDV